MPPGMDIFISYCHQDLHVVAAMESGLRAAGFTVWRDATQIRGGQSLGTEIEQAIQSAACVVACLSAASVGSNWVRAEMRRAKNKLLPVKVGPFHTTVDLDAELGSVFCRDVTPWVQGTSNLPWEELVKDCRVMVGKPAGPLNAPPLPPPPHPKSAPEGVTFINSGTIGTAVGHIHGSVTIGKVGNDK